MHPPDSRLAPDEATPTDDEASLARRRRRVRLLLAAMLVVMPFQAGVAFVASHEMYPAIIMPPFTAVPPVDGWFNLQRIDVRVYCADGSETVVDYKAFFPAMPPAHANIMLLNSLKPRNPRELPPDTGWKAWVKRWIMPVRLIRRRIVDDRELTEQGVAFLRDLATAAVEGCEPVKLAFEFNDFKMRRGADGTERRVIKVGRTELDLTGDDRGLR